MKLETQLKFRFIEKKVIEDSHSKGLQNIKEDDFEVKISDDFKDIFKNESDSTHLQELIEFLCSNP